MLTSEQQAVFELAAQLRSEIAQRIAEYLQTYLDIPRQINQITAGAIALGQLNNAQFLEFEAHLGQQLQSFPDAIALEIYRRGQWIRVMRLPDGSLQVQQQAQTLPFLVNSSGFPPASLTLSQQQVFTEPSSSLSHSNVQLALRGIDPVPNATGEAIALGWVLGLEKVSNYLAACRHRLCGSIFLLDAAGNLVASSASVQPCPDPLLTVASQYLENHFGELGQIDRDYQLQAELNGTGYWIDVFPQTILKLRWLLAIVVSSTELTHPLVGKPCVPFYPNCQLLCSPTPQPRSQSLPMDSQAWWQQLLEASQDGVWDWDWQRGQIFLSSRWKTMLGYDESQLADTVDTWYEQIHPEDRERVERSLLAHCQQQTPSFQCEYRACCKDGSYKWVLDRGQGIWDETGKILRLLGMRTDISAYKAVEDQLRHHAYYDPLTQLPNRSFFLEQLDGALARNRQHCQGFSVLLLDLDRFKVVNESLGHRVGDRLLAQIAQQLHRCLHSEDVLARFGGDEFAILLESSRDISEALATAEYLLAILNQAFPLHGQSFAFAFSASIGIVPIYDPHAQQNYLNAGEAIRDAETAMYSAKRQGKGRYAIFNQGMRLDAIAQLELEAELQQLSATSLRLHYQPIICSNTGKVTGAEALVRWQHPERGLLSPGQFLAIAEETGLIASLGDWVLHRACQQMQQWCVQGLVTPGMILSVNLSGLQLTQPDLASNIEQVLRDNGLEPSYLQLEVTEGAIAEQMSLGSQSLRYLQKLGIQIAIDDFGTGHSSLARLQGFPVNKLKLDRSFITALDEKAQSWQFVRAILNFARSLGLAAIAEGIETLEQERQLKVLGCEYIQGYLYSPPVEAAAMAQLWGKSLLPKPLAVRGQGESI